MDIEKYKESLVSVIKRAAALDNIHADSGKLSIEVYPGGSSWYGHCMSNGEKKILNTTPEQEDMEQLKVFQREQRIKRTWNKLDFIVNEDKSTELKLSIDEALQKRMDDLMNG